MLFTKSKITAYVWEQETRQRTRQSWASTTVDVDTEAETAEPRPAARAVLPRAGDAPVRPEIRNEQLHEFGCKPENWASFLHPKLRQYWLALTGSSMDSKGARLC